MGDGKLCDDLLDLNGALLVHIVFFKGFCFSL